MVVARKAPAAPLSPASRTNSSHLVPRSAATKSKLGQGTANASDLSAALANGQNADRDSKEISRDNDDASKKTKGKSKQKAKKGGKKPKGRASLADVLLRYLLLFFTIYTLSVCPNDTKLESSVCRGLSEYRRLILEPYVFPAINTALAHPSIAPHVQRVKPYTDRAIQIATPIALRTHSEWTNRVAPQWNQRVVPQWEKRVVPQWNKHVVPQWEQHVVPQYLRVTSQVQPYLTAIEHRYEAKLGPHLRSAIRNANRFQRATQPYVVLAAQKSYSGYQIAKPYAVPLWERVKALAKHLLVLLRVQRRKFVDPHVAKIWARMQELSSGTPNGDIPVPSPAVEQVPPAPASVPSPSSAEPEASEPVGSTPVVIVPNAGSPSTPSMDHSAITESAVAPERIETGESAASVILKSVHTGAPVVSETPEPSSASSLDPTPSSSSVPLAPPIASDFDEFDIEAFAADLGLDKEEDIVPDEQEAVHEEVETEEEKAERLRVHKEEVAEKRRKLMARHTQWEDDLEMLIKDKKKAVRKSLVALRKAATAELKSSKDIKGSIDGLVVEAEKFLKGAEAYLKNLRKDSRTQQEKLTLWSKVVEKVDAKFNDRLQETEVTVNEWYNKALSSEEEEVAKAASEVRDLADRAQADIGLDYAWLDDVTYQDWQRYHDLLKQSDNFTAHVQSVQNGSHPSPPINPVQPALEELESEVKDIITGFETRLRRIKRSGDRVFGGEVPEDAHADEDALDGDVGTAKEPLVSILPVPSDRGEVKEAVLNVIGRGKEEVEEALARAQALLGYKDVPEEQAKSAEKVASSIAREVEAQAQSDMPVSSAITPPVREEL